MNKGKVFFIVLIVFLMTSLTGLYSQQKEIERLEKRTEEFLSETQWKRTVEYNRFTYEFGGWLGYNYFNYEDQDNNSNISDSLENLHLLDLRLWSRGRWKNGNEYYVRLKTYMLNFNYSEGFSADDEDVDGPHVEMAYLTIPSNQRYKLYLGRQKFQAGKGIAYNEIHDGIKLQSEFGNHRTIASISQTRPDEKDIDNSIPGITDSDRKFYMIQHEYTNLQGTKWYAYYLSQQDDNIEKPQDAVQDFNYDSRYFGIGFDGNARSNIHYYGEYIKQSGESTASASTAKHGIDAWAGILGVTWFGKGKLKPTLHYEWAGGSGDADRLSVTDTIGGNQINTGDENFLYFGYWNTGIALNPRLSNLKISKLGFTFKPFVDNRSFENLLIGIQWYNYDKWEGSGGISDPEAVLTGTNVGNEVDLSLNWKVYSDLFVYVNYGVFSPGNAYHSNAHDKEELLQTGFTILF